MTLAMRLTALMACTVLTVAAVAVPIRRGTRTVMQPDGTCLTLTVTGSEKGWCNVTADGIAVVQDKDGCWKYARDFRNGTLIPSQFTAHDGDSRSASESAWIRSVGNVAGAATSADRLAESRTYAMSGRAAVSTPYAIGNYPRTGRQNCLVILVDFPDKSFSRPDGDMLLYYDSLFNCPDYSRQVTVPTTDDTVRTFQITGSVRDYFANQSFGKFVPSFNLIGPVTADKPFAYYGKNSGTYDYRENELANEITRKITEGNLADLGDYDAQGTGQVDLLGIIYAGRGENYQGADPNTIWPHTGSVEGNFGPVTKVNYFMTCELYWNTDSIIDGMGVFCHEFSHILGLPDFYSNDNTLYHMGRWSLMDYGTYSAEGFVPSGYTAFERYCLGWMELTDIEDPGTYSLGDLSEGVAFRMGTDDPDRFLVLENHNMKEWFRYQESGGLMLTQVDYSGKMKMKMPNYDSKRHYVIPADNLYSIDNEEGDLYPYNGNDSITWYSRPRLAISGQDYQGLRIYGIRKNGETVSFTLGNSTTSVIQSGAACPTVANTADGVLINAPTGTRIGLYDLSGRLVLSSVMSGSTHTLELPDHGAWILRCGGLTRKIIR